MKLHPFSWVEPSLVEIQKLSVTSVLICLVLQLIRQHQHEGEVPIWAWLCPSSQRWQMCCSQWKYWELAGHLSANVWAIWAITFCKWTQIKMYDLPLLCLCLIPHRPRSYITLICFLFHIQPGVQAAGWRPWVSACMSALVDSYFWKWARTTQLTPTSVFSIWLSEIQCSVYFLNT